MNTGEDETVTIIEKFYDENEEYSPPESKRMRLDDGCNNNLNSTLNSASKNGAKWTCPGDTSLVEPEIMEDMGVSMLEDEEASCESIKKLRSQESEISPTSSDSGRQILERDNVDSEGNEPLYRGSSYDDAKLDRLEQDPFDQEDPAVYGGTKDNESGYASRVETETFPDGKQSFTKDDSISNADNSAIDHFYLYRRKKKPSFVGEDKFNKLSDEMILSILKWLPKKCLVRSMLVCKRWCQIARDEALWTRLDLGGKVLSEGTLGHIIPRGVQILRLAQAEIADPVFQRSSDCGSNVNVQSHSNGSTDDAEFQPFSEVLVDGYVSKLQYLDLSMAVISADGLAELLSQCRLLKKLSLERCTLNESCCEAISRNVDLTVLNLAMCDQINVNCIKNLTKLKSLNSLNMAWCSLDATSMGFLCKSLPSSITRLNLSGCRKTIFDDDVKELVKSCPDVVELDLSDCTLLTINTIHNLMNLGKLEHLSLSRCYCIPTSTYSRLVLMPSLLFLDVFGLMPEPILASLRSNSGGTEINKFLFSSVARPTVGVRRTSIWGHRVRD